MGESRRSDPRGGAGGGELGDFRDGAVPGSVSHVCDVVISWPLVGLHQVSQPALAALGGKSALPPGSATTQKLRFILSSAANIRPALCQRQCGALGAVTPAPWGTVAGQGRCSEPPKWKRQLWWSGGRGSWVPQPAGRGGCWGALLWGGVWPGTRWSLVLVTDPSPGAFRVICLRDRGLSGHSPASD